MEMRGTRRISPWQPRPWPVSGLVDINVAVINPYVGGLGDLMTMVEPSIAQAVQDIESSSFLPGFRLNAYLVAAWTCW